MNPWMLRAMRRARTMRILRSVALVVIAVSLFVLAAIVAVAIAIESAFGQNLPDVDRLSEADSGTTTTRIVARDGTLLARLYDKNRVYVPITRIAEPMKQAIVASEDERFYEHRGVDARSIIRAAVADFRHEQIQGASTITQQLARTLFLNRNRTIARKVQEALLAIELERYYTKDEILERYLNLIYFGAGAYGVQAASQAYFGKDASKLTLPEAAMLAGVVAAPSVYSPYVDQVAAKERQRRVLERMVALGEITPAQADEAATAPLTYVAVAPPGVEAYKYPYFTTYVIAQLEKNLGTDQMLHGGLTVYTTLDPKLQRIAQNSVTTLVEQGRKEGYGMHEGALVAEDPRSGEILAMVGGIGFTAKNQFNRAWQARRQPGSSFKGFVYSTAVDRGTPVNSIYSDSPVTYPAGDGTEYSPSDDDHRYLGAMSLRKAFALSRNIVAVKLAYDIGIDNVVQYAHAMGITEDLEPDLSLALGTAVVSPLDMVSGYSTIAAGGVYTPPTAIRYVTDRYGGILLDERYPKRSVAMSSGAAYIMTSLMEGVITEGTGYPNAIIGRPAAGKTGTTSSFRDAWFVGFVPQLAAATWVGNDDYTPMIESYGGNIPARTWAHFMKAA
ncbi:MAG: PBP1A family penicillin-binding protein, partial [Candidatus Eremiobacteraeota bacterium]|nr:PBP1A family penicillin-binding protein [Candidatus Eremiobacteraeota bacterium]